MRPPIYDFSDVNWQLPNAVIARQLGCNPCLVAYHRRKSPLAQKQRQRIIYTFLWASLDWSQKNTVIAKQVGYTPVRISQMRKKIKTQTDLGFCDLVYSRLIMHRIAQEMAIHDANHSRKLRLSPKGYAKARSRYKNVDWSKTPSEIADQLDVHISTVIRMKAKLYGGNP